MAERVHLAAWADFQTSLYLVVAQPASLMEGKTSCSRLVWMLPHKRLAKGLEKYTKYIDTNLLKQVFRMRSLEQLQQ